MIGKLKQRSPAAAWALVVALLGVGAYIAARPFLSASSQESLGADVVIRFEDTGDEMRIQRGRFERMMLEQGVEAPLDPSKGINNPKTNKPTGFPVDREYWNGLVNAVNEAMKRPSATGSGKP